MVLLTKQYMSHTHLSQQPIKVFAPNKLGEMPLSGPKDVSPRNLMNEKLVTEYMKTANLVEQEPWVLKQAAEYLRTWTSNNQNMVKKEAPFFEFKKMPDTDQYLESAITPDHKLLQEFAPDPPKIVTIEAGPPPRADAKAKAKAKAKANAQPKTAPKAKSKAEAKPKAKAKATPKATLKRPSSSRDDTQSVLVILSVCFLMSLSHILSLPKK